MSKAQKLLLAILVLSYTFVNAEDVYPNKPISIIVGFGRGGSTDALARSMAPYLSKALNVPIKIKNIPGRGSALAIEAFLKTKNDGYTILCSAFSPYLPVAILKNETNATMDSLDYLNIQSYGFDIVAVNEKSVISSLPELLLSIKNRSKKLKVAVVENSNGYLLLKLMFRSMHIPISNIEVYRYNSGGDARRAIANNEMDVIIISSKKSEFIREYITPLAIYAEERQLDWDIPTVNESLMPLGFHVPHMPDYMRGFAVQKELQQKYPSRYKRLYTAFMFLIAKKSVQRELKKNKVGGTWTGAWNSAQSLMKAYNIFKKYTYLLNDVNTTENP